MNTQPQQTDIDPETLQRPEGNDIVSNYQVHDVGEAYFTGRLNERGFLVEEWGLDDRHNDEGLVFDNKMDLRLWEPLDGQVTPPQDAPDKLGSREDTTTVYSGDGGEWELCGVADVKTKTNEDWFGVFNLRHLTHYSQWADWYGADSGSASPPAESDNSTDENVPVFIYFTMVDNENKRVHAPNGLVEIPSNWDFAALADHYDRDSDFSLSYQELTDHATNCPIVGRAFTAPDRNVVVSVADEIDPSVAVDSFV
jgi:hypothetical protein